MINVFEICATKLGEHIYTYLGDILLLAFVIIILALFH